jgi:PAS domain S-box-containing protein
MEPKDTGTANIQAVLTSHSRQYRLWEGLARVNPTLVTIGGLILATFLRAAFTPLWGEGFTFITFFPIIMLITVVGGWKHGLAATAISCLLAFSVFFGIRLPSLNEAAALTMFALANILIIFITEVITRVRRQSDMEAAVAKGRAETAWQEVAALRQAEEALQVSEERFHSLFTNMTEGFSIHNVITDAQGSPCDYRFIDVNPAFERLTGRQREDWIGKRVREVLPDIESYWIENFGNVALKGESVHFDNYSAPLGKWYHVFAYRPAPGQFAVISADITERKQAEAKLRKLNRTLQALTASGHAMLVANDESTLLNEVCNIIIQYCGYSMVWIGFAENDADKSVRPVAHAGFEGGYLDAMNITWAETTRGLGPTGTAIRTTQPVICRNMLFDPQFEPWREQAIKQGYASSVVLPLMNAGKAFGALNIYSSEPDPFSEDEINLLTQLADDLAYGIGVRQMRAAHGQTEEKLYESGERMASIVASAMDAIISMNEQQQIILFNAAAEKMFGYTASEVIGQPLTMLLPERYRASHSKHVLGFATTGVTTRRMGALGEISGCRADGVEFPIEAAISQVRLAGSKMFTVVLRDVTARKKAEQELLEADRRKDEFLATLAHELRNPLAPLRNSLHILHRLPGADGEAATKVYSMRERQVTHLTHLVDDLLEVSRITRGKIGLRKERTDLATSIRNAVEMSRPLIESAGHQFTLTLPAEPLIIEADPARLAQVFANLLNNAAKYTNNNGQISLTARHEGTEAVVSVRDNGTGIPDDMLPRVFDMFTQVDRTQRRSQGGLGIGLTLAQSLVQMHGGHIEAHSAGAGQGSEFLVYLPLAPPLPDASAAQAASMETASNPAVKMRILVVDDNQDVADSLGMLLQLSGYDVQTVYDGPLALATISSYKPDVVLLDIGMPGMNGYEVARQVRKQPGFEDLPLVALTGWGQEEDRQRSKEAGFNHHIVKPVDSEILERVLEELSLHPTANP